MVLTCIQLYTQILNTGIAPVHPPNNKLSNTAMCPLIPLYKLKAEALIEPEVTLWGVLNTKGC